MPPSTPRFAEPVASYATYADAEEAVSVLAESGFPVEEATIVAGDLRLVEHVTGRRSLGAAALQVFGHALAGRRRDVWSMATLDAERYDVMAPANVAGEARRMLASPRAA